MENADKKVKSSKVNAWMRRLHRDAGGLVVALAIVFTLSGSIMVFRDIEFLEQEVEVHKTLEAGLDANAVRDALRIRQFRLRGRTAGPIIEFEGGRYDSATGEATYIVKGYPAPVLQFTNLHKATSGKPFFVVTLFFALALLTLVVTSFWMYKPGTPQFKRFSMMVGAGVVGTILVLFLV